MSDSRFFIRTSLMVTALLGQLLFVSISLASNDVIFLDGAKASLKKETLRLIINDNVAWKKNLPKEYGEGKPSLTIHPMEDGLTALHLIVEGGGSGRFELVAVRRNASRKLNIVWKTETTARGDLGERAWQAVRFNDLTGDGKPEIIIGTIWESLTLCGSKKPPLLFRKVYDPTRQKLRTIAAGRPGLQDAIEIKGEIDANEKIGAPLIPIANPKGVSSQAGDNNDPLFLTPPYALVDGNLKTAWIPGSTNEVGEFATFSITTTAYGIIKVGIRSLPEGEKSKKYQAPTSLLLATDKQVYRLIFPEQTEGDKTVWFNLPDPLKTSCFSLVVERVSGAKRKPLALSEILLTTELDTEDGLNRAVHDLSNDKLGEQAFQVLRRLGPRSINLVKEAWETLNASGKRRAVRLLAELTPKESVELLAQVAVGEDDASAATAAAGLNKAKDAGVIALVGFLSSTQSDKFEKAARILAGFNTERSLEGLMSAAGQGIVTRRRMLRDFISISANHSNDHAMILWRGIESSIVKNNHERLLDLLRSAATITLLHEKVTSVTISMFKESTDFKDRYRLLEVLSLTLGEETKEILLATTEDNDKIIRSTAILGLAKYDDEQVVQTLLGALKDKEVMVREAALRVLSLTNPKDAAAEIIVKLAAEDPWPMIRVLALETAPILPGEIAAKMIANGIKDSSRQVRTTALKNAASFHQDMVTTAINEILSNIDEHHRVHMVAADTAGMRCVESSIPLLAQLLKRGAKQLAPTEHKQVAIAAALAMGSIGGEQAKILLKKIRDHSNPTTDRAIDAALKNLGARCNKI